MFASFPKWFCSTVAALLIFTAGTLSLPAQDHHSQPVPTIIFVHGAWADGSSWSRVIPRLKNCNVVSVQIPLTSFADDVAAVQRAIARQSGPILLVGHSYGGTVITEAGNDPKVTGLVYVAAFAPDQGQSTLDLAGAHPAPGLTQVVPDSFGFLTLTETGIQEDFAQDVSKREQEILFAVQEPASIASFLGKVTTPAWKTKRTWFIVAGADRMIPPDFEESEADQIGATTITIFASHVVMISHPEEVASFIREAASGRP